MFLLLKFFKTLTILKIFKRLKLNIKKEDWHKCKINQALPHKDKPAFI